MFEAGPVRRERGRDEEGFEAKSEKKRPATLGQRRLTCRDDDTQMKRKLEID